MIDVSQLMPLLEQLRMELATAQDKLSFLRGVNVGLAELNDAVKAINELLDIPPDIELGKGRPQRKRTSKK